MNRALVWMIAGLFAGYGVFATVRMKHLEARLSDLERRHQGEVVALRGDVQSLRKELQRLRSPRVEPLAMR